MEDLPLGEDKLVEHSGLWFNGRLQFNLPQTLGYVPIAEELRFPS